MAQVTLTIHNKDFTIACQDGQEDILMDVGEKLNEKITSLAESFPTAGTEFLMVFANLMMADEIKALGGKIETLETQLAQSAQSAQSGGLAEGGASTNDATEPSVLALRLENIAVQIETITAQLEKL